MGIFDDPIDPVADIAGIIMPHNWDENGIVIQIAIYTNKEEVYLIEPNQKEKELFNYINRRVAVKGKMLTRNHVNRQCIVVKNYSLLADDVDDEKSII